MKTKESNKREVLLKSFTEDQRYLKIRQQIEEFQITEAVLDELEKNASLDDSSTTPQFCNFMHSKTKAISVG